MSEKTRLSPRGHRCSAGQTLVRASVAAVSTQWAFVQETVRKERTMWGPGEGVDVPQPGGSQMWPRPGAPADPGLAGRLSGTTV